jgi:hypothetical protein
MYNHIQYTSLAFPNRWEGILYFPHGDYYLPLWRLDGGGEAAPCGSEAEYRTEFFLRVREFRNVFFTYSISP